MYTIRFHMLSRYRNRSAVVLWTREKVSRIRVALRQSITLSNQGRSACKLACFLEKARVYLHIGQLLRPSMFILLLKAQTFRQQNDSSNTLSRRLTYTNVILHQTRAYFALTNESQLGRT